MNYQCPRCGSKISIKIVYRWRHTCTSCKSVIGYTPSFLIAAALLASCYLFLPSQGLIGELSIVIISITTFALLGRYFLRVQEC
ncbi:hypothetical protein EDC56_1481 [Sinobacterium caligoides]|uniref:Uncharacterized protein n=1 Tax=Sinobacterium caligoides TaxID=933926 RepID=A0A3N2DML8_9GAMM|nr:zinc ribbon domain-containing protein [Sinobacterium caligoides]ROS01057.1 hypothetical protein EDC56_1481 [Sinobacterium caligoides]